MVENNLELIGKSETSWLNNKLLFSLSFILVIYALKDYIVGLFQEDFVLSLFSINFLPEQLLNIMFLIFLISLYLYAFNYFFKDPLKFKFMNYLNKIASFTWALFLLFPFFIVLIWILKLLISNKEILFSILGVILGIGGVLVGYKMGNLFSRQTKDLSLRTLDTIIEKIKYSPDRKDKISQFLKLYLILETQIKKSLLVVAGIDVVTYKSINLQEAIKALHVKKFINSNQRDLFLKIWNLRNEVIHINKKPSEKDIKKTENAIKEIEFKLRDIINLKKETKKRRIKLRKKES